MSREWIPYGRQLLDQADIDAVTRTLQGEWLTTGPAVESFEHALARTAGASAVVVSSGTAALHCAYAAAGVGRGNEVVTTPMTFVATAAVASQLGAKVRFVDVSDASLNLDPAAVSEALSTATRVVSAVDFAGHPADLDLLRDVADSVGAVLVEDASHSLGATYRGVPVGSIADLTTFSFHPVKTITTGEGGAITGGGQLLEAARRFRNHGLVREQSAQLRPEEGPWHQEVHTLGLNYRLPDPLAALGESQLKKLPAFLARRRTLAQRYFDSLSDVEGLRLPEVAAHVESAWHIFAVRVRDRRRRFVYQWLRDRRIGAQVHYLPAHLHPVYAEMGYRRGMCPVAEEAYEEILSLPLFPALTDRQQDRVISEVRDALGA